MSRKIEERNDTLNYVRNNGRATKMIPIADNEFKWVGLNIPVIVKFDNLNSQKKFSLKFPDEVASEFTAYTPVSSYSPSNLNAFSGDYYSSELDIIYTLKVERNGIMLYVKGDSVATLTPIMNNVLKLAPYLTFEFNEAKDIFKLSSGRVKNLKFVKR